jgi:hypothetical protein
MVLGEIRAEIAAQALQREADLTQLEAELRTARAEQKRLAQAVALADDVPELVSELRQRSTRIQNLEACRVSRSLRFSSRPRSRRSSRQPRRSPRRGRAPVICALFGVAASAKRRCHRSRWWRALGDDTCSAARRGVGADGGVRWVMTRAPGAARRRVKRRWRRGQWRRAQREDMRQTVDGPDKSDHPGAVVSASARPTCSLPCEALPTAASSPRRSTAGRSPHRLFDLAVPTDSSESFGARSASMCEVQRNTTCFHGSRVSRRGHVPIARRPGSPSSRSTQPTRTSST